MADRSQLRLLRTAALGDDVRLEYACKDVSDVLRAGVETVHDGRRCLESSTHSTFSLE